ncbi:MAG: hypothetical protein LBQ10_09815 [Desulfovibrio sp.]|jgi:hypothetical protein|nr:hypothetical protein [Desulfovibrio sp.]
MRFRDALAADIDAVFLNAEEFAREIKFNGETVRAVIDDSHAPFDGAAGDGLADMSGLALRQRTRVVRTADRLARRVAPEQRVTLDGGRWTVASVAAEDGLLVITLTEGYA